MESTRTTSRFRMQGRIDAQVHDVEALRSQVDEDWDELSPASKMAVARDTEPTAEQTVFNVTTDRFHEYFVDNLDPNQTAAKDNIDAQWIALGTDGGAGTATSDTDLNSRQYSEMVTSHSDNGKDLLASVFLDSTEGNGNSFNELGLFTGDPSNIGNADVFMINHASFGAIAKDNSGTITFDVTLTFSDV